MRRRRPIEILWCQNRKAHHPKRAGWSFPMEVEEKIREVSCDGSVVHFFGGQAKFGVRMDVDPATAPHVIGDAWLPPFAKASFDTVVLDPPYATLPREELFQLLYQASWVARRRVIWLHQIWTPSGAGLSLERGWLVRCGDSLVVRCFAAIAKCGVVTGVLPGMALAVLCDRLVEFGFEKVRVGQLAHDWNLIPANKFHRATSPARKVRHA